MMKGARDCALVAAITLLCNDFSSVSALVPHQYWNSNNNKALTNRQQHNEKHSSSRSMTMYFDDASRFELNHGMDPEPFWKTPSDEKLYALQRLLGFTQNSACKVSNEVVQSEMKQWAQDTQAFGSKKKYSGIMNGEPQVGISTSVVGALAEVWQTLVYLMDHPPKKSDNNDIHLISFPHIKDLWDYQTFATMLMAIEFSKEFLQDHDITLDVFHPKYKDSPSLWSPERHAPFPTIGLQVYAKPKYMMTSSSSIPIIGTSSSYYNLESTKKRLEALFQSPSAERDRRFQEGTFNQPTDSLREECSKWILDQKHQLLNGKPVACDFTVPIDRWVVSQHETANKVYKDIWSVMQSVLPGRSCMVILTHFGAQDVTQFKRFAITINSALKRLTNGKISLQIFHPHYVCEDLSIRKHNNNHDMRRSPHAMIQIVHSKQ